jgi:hypothetical protein
MAVPSELVVVVWLQQESTVMTWMVPGVAAGAEALKVMAFDTQTTLGLALALPPEK